MFLEVPYLVLGLQVVAAGLARKASPSNRDSSGEYPRRPEGSHPMEALDASGRPLYCGEDGAALEAAGDAHGVLACPNCGHRTDVPGRGVLDTAST